MDVWYCMDPDTGQPHIYGHGVMEAEVEWILARPSKDGAAEGNSCQALGHTEGGRYLRVIYASEEEGDGVFVVTPYRLEGMQLHAFRRRQRRRKR